MKCIKYIVAVLLLFIIVGCSGGAGTDGPPEAVIEINNETIETSKGSYHWETGFITKRSVIADTPAPFQIAEDMEAKVIPQGSNSSIEFSDGSNPNLNVYVWEGEKRGQELVLNQNQFPFPAQAGSYIIEIFARWPNGDASYTFVVEVQ
jgi:hypothetical protein